VYLPQHPPGVSSYLIHSLLRFSRLIALGVVCMVALIAKDLSSVSSAVEVLPAIASVQFFYLC
jgi:hypothetical protein